MFQENKKDLGTIKVGSHNEIIFPYTSDMIVTRMESPCDCSTIYNNQVNKNILILYKPKEVPQHLKSVGRYLTEKVFTISFTLNSEPEKPECQTVISFIAEVIE